MRVDEAGQHQLSGNVHRLLALEGAIEGCTAAIRLL